MSSCHQHRQALYAIYLYWKPCSFLNTIHTGGWQRSENSRLWGKYEIAMQIREKRHKLWLLSSWLQQITREKSPELLVEVEILSIVPLQLATLCPLSTFWRPREVTTSLVVSDAVYPLKHGLHRRYHAVTSTHTHTQVVPASSRATKLARLW